MFKKGLILGGLVVGWFIGCQGMAPSQTFQELHDFTCAWSDTTGWDCSSNGVGPQCGLVQGHDGNFYGTTTAGGHWGSGSIFRISPHGELKTLAHFDGTNGSWPSGALLEVGNGTFYGTTRYRFGNGNFFRFTETEGIQDLPPAPGVYPLGDLAMGPDGKLYGVTQGARGHVPGTVFVASTNGPIRSLHLFDTDEAFAPSGGLLLASDGFFYGVTAGGGLWGGGTVYRIGTNGDFAVIASFLHWIGNAEGPAGRLCEGPDGGLYGAARDAVFRVTKQGDLITLAGVYEDPVGPLVLASDGNFYGCTSKGGDFYIPPGPCGSVFRMSPDGAVTTVFSFTAYWAPCPGAHPSAGLVQGKDGNLYGTTYDGGVNGGGNVFRLIMPGNCALDIQGVAASPAVLWPPNHKMVPVTVSVSATDNCGPVHSRIVSVSSNEGSAADSEITGDLTANLRAERSGKGAGRVYTITVECTDDFGNKTNGVAHVTVPH
jgi:uncharacterized repeat protein (TIGR03803 family)